MEQIMIRRIAEIAIATAVLVCIAAMGLTDCVSETQCAAQHKVAP